MCDSATKAHLASRTVSEKQQLLLLNENFVLSRDGKPTIPLQDQRPDGGEPIFTANTIDR